MKRDLNFEKDHRKDFESARLQLVALVKAGGVLPMCLRELERNLLDNSETSNIILDLAAGFAVYYKHQEV